MTQIRVAIVEDHTLTRMGLRGALEDRDDIEVVGEAANGADGLSLLLALQPDVAIIDIGLPDFDGIELLRQFKAARPTDPTGISAVSPTRVLILTMQDKRVEVLAAFAAGADSYCVKDTGIEQLTEAVLTTAEGQSWIDPAIASIVLEQVRAEQSEAQLRSPAAGQDVLIHGLEPEAERLLKTDPLTARELQVLELIVGGHSNTTIGETLHLSIGTVKTHVRNILSKLCASDRTEAAVRALRSGLIK